MSRITKDATLDMVQNSIENAVFQTLTVPPVAPKIGQYYFDTAREKIGVYLGTDWLYIGVGAGVLKVEEATGETVIHVDNTHYLYPKLTFLASTTQGENVTLSKEVDGLRVSVGRGNLTTAGLLKLTNAVSSTDESNAVTPKGANVQVAKLSTPEAGCDVSYSISQGGTVLPVVISVPKYVKTVSGSDTIAIDNSDTQNLKASVKVSATQGESVLVTKETDGLKVEVGVASKTKKGIVKLSSTPSNTDESNAVTPKGANITVTKQSTPDTGFLATYQLAQGGVNIAEKINVPGTIVEDATTTKKGIVKLSNTPSSTDESTACTPKGANVTVSKIASETNDFATYQLAQGGTALSQKINVAKIELEKQATAEDGYFATYILKQGGTALSEKINIPKDFLVKKAEIKTCTEKDKPEAGLEIGDKYIDFTINVKSGTATAEHIYLNVKDLCDVYTGGDGIIVGTDNTVNIDNTTDERTEKAIYKATISKNGLITSSEKVEAVKMFKQVVVMPMGDTTCGVTLPTTASANAVIVSWYCTKADGTVVLTEAQVKSNGVIFTLGTVCAEDLYCYVVYSDLV